MKRVRPRQRIAMPLLHVLISAISQGALRSGGTAAAPDLLSGTAAASARIRVRRTVGMAVDGTTAGARSAAHVHRVGNSSADGIAPVEIDEVGIVRRGGAVLPRYPVRVMADETGDAPIPHVGPVLVDPLVDESRQVPHEVAFRMAPETEVIEGGRVAQVGHADGGHGVPGHEDMFEL